MQPILTEPLEAFGFPITLAFSKQGEAFVTERISGRLWQIDGGQNHLVCSFPTAPLIGHHETGLLGLALDPDFEASGYFYCYYTAGSTNSYFNRVVRFKRDTDKEEILLDRLPAGTIHNGGILAFAPDKTLYIGIGVNNEEKAKSQDLKFFGGKILRINRDGSIPKDNPFADSPVYSYGHRNIFGLAFHPKTGQLFACDVGPDHDDEINIIKKGGNYGWPEVMGASDNPKFVNPLVSYTPTITPTQCTFVGNDFLFAAYNNGTVHRLVLEGPQFDKVERDLVVYQDQPYQLVGVFHGPDQKFYLTTASSVKPFEAKIES